MPAADPALRERLLEAAYACVARFGLAKTTVEDVVKESGVSRATVYRVFPGGKDELLAPRSWRGRWAGSSARLAEAVAGAARLRVASSRSGLVFAHGAVDEHEVLQKVLVTEPERLLPLHDHRAGPARCAFITALPASVPRARAARRAAPSPASTSTAVGRLRRPHAPLAHRLAGPAGTSTTPRDVRVLVRTQLLAGVLTSDALTSG